MESARAPPRAQPARGLRRSRRWSIEIVFELLFSIIWEFLIQFVGEILFEAGFRTLSEPFRDRRRRHPVIALFGVAAMGSLTGGLSVLLLPDRIFGVTGVPGLSLIVAPLLNASLMEVAGRSLEARTGRRPAMATFWAGGVFAFSVALVRFLVIDA